MGKIVLFAVNWIMWYEQYINSIFRDDIETVDMFIYTQTLRKRFVNNSDQKYNEENKEYFLILYENNTKLLYM